MSNLVNHNVLAMMRKLAPKEFLFDEKALVKYLPFKLPGRKLAQICSALNSGKNIIFVGAPGTGKTTVAQAVCRAAYSLFLSFGKGIFTTGTADWTTFHTVGGYMPDVSGSGRLVFSPGIITRAIIDRHWLILDEINRTDIDKVIGPFFSVLSEHEVVLPFKNSEGAHFVIRLGASDSTETEFYVHPHWRLIGTMNDFDKHALYNLSYAFMRRFAIISIDTPSPMELIKIMSRVVPECDLNNGMNKLVCITKYRELGPGIFLDMARYIATRGAAAGAQTEEHACEAAELFLLPQFQGLPMSVNQKIAEIIRKALPNCTFDESKMEFANN